MFGAYSCFFLGGALEDPNPEILGGVASTLLTILEPGNPDEGAQATVDASVASKGVDMASSVMQASQYVKSGLPKTAAESLVGAGVVCNPT